MPMNHIRDNHVAGETEDADFQSWANSWVTLDSSRMKY